MSTVKTAIRARVSMTLNRCAATNASYGRTRRTPIDPSFCALMRWYKDLRDDELAPKVLTIQLQRYLLHTKVLVASPYVQLAANFTCRILVCEGERDCLSESV